MKEKREYDRNIKMYDEAHAPCILEKMSKNKNPNTGKFLTDAHFFSYYLQMRKIKALNVETVLEVGPGENFIQEYMKSLGIEYDTMDIIPESNPTYLSSLENFELSCLKFKYDLVCSFQMLEHSEYSNFSSNLEKLRKMSTKYVFLSLPYSCNKFSIKVNIQLGQNKIFSKMLQLIFPTNKANRVYREEYKTEFPWAVHHWEIGRKGYLKKKVMNDIRASGLKIIDTFHSENAFHYFILAEI